MLIRFVRNRIHRMREESLARGRARGRKEGAAEALQRQLELKFGPLPASYVTLIREAELHLLMRWAERVLMAVNLSAVFEGEPGDVAG